MLKHGKRRLLVAVIAICLLFSMALSAGARASEYVDGVYAQLIAEGGGVMYLLANVDGVERMSKIGLDFVIIEEAPTSTGPWSGFDIWDGEDNTDLYYWYNESIYLEEFNFDGTPGMYYRVTLIAYAGITGQGSDTSTLTTRAVKCL